MNVWEANTWNL